MIIPSRRKLGAAALIIAGIGAFLVPFLLHSPTTQGTSSNNGGTNPNNGSHTTTPTPTTPTPTTPTKPGTKDDGGKDTDDSGGSPTGTGTCSADKAKDPSPADNGEGKHNGNAWGVLKNQMGMTVAAVKAMGTHNTAFHLHHDTKTDNDTVKAHTSSGDSNENDSSCADEKTETNDD